MKLFEDVGTSAKDIRAYLAAQKRHYARRDGKKSWDEVDEKEKIEAAQDLCSSLYQDLSIVDAKAGGLIASNAIVTAIFALVSLTPPGAGGSETPDAMWFASTAIVIVSLAALVLNVSVLNLYWLTASQIEQPEPDEDPFLRAVELIKRRNRRTMRYRIAYRLHLALLAFALLMFIVLLASALV